jgi:eukaryotic-like serine/threonine-protein kinase
MSAIKTAIRFGAGFGIFVVLAVLVGWLTLMIMTSGGDVYIPDLTGLSLQNAIGSLQGNQLYIVLDGEEFHPEAPRGAVIAQNPDAGTLRKRFSTVRVILSAGPKRLEMPDLRGYGLRQARVEASNLIDGFFIENYIRHSEYSEGEVVAHIPGPGEIVVPKSNVSLLISSGPEKKRYRMPDCIGKTLGETRGLLQAFSSRLDITVSERQDFGPGIVINQSPKAGSPLNETDRIILTVTPRETGFFQNQTTRFLWTVPEGERHKGMIVTYTVNENTEILAERDVYPGEQVVLHVPATGKGVLDIHLDGTVVLSEVR